MHHRTARRAGRRAATLAACAIVLAACAGANPPPFPVAPAGGSDSVSTLVLQPGDVVRIQVFGRNELAGEYPVDENSLLLLPLIGEINVRGLTVSALRAHIRAQYGQLFQQSFVSVIPLFRVAVLGEVVRPGLHSADPTMTVFDLLALAGGVMPTGRAGALRLIRDGNTYSLRLDAASLANATLRELGVRSGDQMIVPRRTFTAENNLVILTIANTMLLAYSIFR
jgi:polysaccharide export outer membrane protein